jgi:mannobiose 2-epimerase
MEDLASRAEAELRGDILPFWLRHARDRERGGFFGEISNDLVVRRNAPRGALLSARILWTFSATYRRYHDPDYLEMARWACQDLETRFWDREYGGYFWRIAANGTPLDQTKQVYVQAFGIYALAEYFRASGEQAALNRAVELYRLVEQHSRDRRYGGYLEAFSRDWKRPRGRRLSALGPEFPKSQNTHLHLMEAYTNLLRAWPDPELRSTLRGFVEVMLDRVLSPDHRHLRLFFDMDWTPRSDVISFGHDIEASWLLTESAELVGDPALLARVKDAALTIACGTLAGGVDGDGGVFNEVGPRGLADTGKDWWPQAEATVGFVNAYQISGDPRFLAAAQRTWNFIEKRLIDHEHGEWYWGVKRDGTVRPRTVKAGFWKCPYHNSRACLELAERLRALAAPADPVGR